MTTEDTIKKLVEEGKLRQFVPVLFPDEVHTREFFMTDILWRHLDGDVLEKYGLEYQVKVEQHLTQFARGDKIRGGRHIKEVEPFGNGVWAFRILEDPQTRIFGGFIKDDWFVAFYMEKRSSLNGRFTDFAKRVKNQWSILFKEKKMLLSSNINDLISNGVNDDKRKKQNKPYTRKDPFK